jgi:hypothetical protein
MPCAREYVNVPSLLENPVGCVSVWLERVWVPLKPYWAGAVVVVAVVTTVLWFAGVVARALEGDFFPTVELVIVMVITALLLTIGHLLGRRPRDPDER